MKIFCCYTPAHEILYKNYFSASLPNSFEINDEIIDIKGDGDYLSPEFLRCINSKVELIVSSIKNNESNIIIWSDVDIVFFDISPESILKDLGDNDLAFQREGYQTTEVNTGFIVVRCSDKSKKFFEKVLLGLKNNQSANEQLIINNIIKSGDAGVDWTYLPFKYYARTQGWPPPQNLSLYHANATIGKNGIKQKIDQFRECSYLRRFPVFGRIILGIKYVPRRIKRIAGSFLR